MHSSPNKVPTANSNILYNKGGKGPEPYETVDSDLCMTEVKGSEAFEAARTGHPVIYTTHGKGGSE